MAEPMRLPAMIPSDQQPCEVFMISLPLAFSTRSASTFMPSSTKEIEEPASIRATKSIMGSGASTGRQTAME